MKKLTLVLAALLLAFCFHPARAGAQAPPGPIPPVAQQASPDSSQPPAPSAAPQVSPQKITAYTLPPDLYKKTERLSKIRLAFIIGGTIYGLIALWLVLRLKIAPKYRSWAERASSNLSGSSAGVCSAADPDD